MCLCSMVTVENIVTVENSNGKGQCLYHQARKPRQAAEKPGTEFKQADEGGQTALRKNTIQKAEEMVQIRKYC